MTDDEFAAGVDEIITTTRGHAAHRALDALWTRYAVEKGGLIASATLKWMAAIEGHHCDDNPYPLGALPMSAPITDAQLSELEEALARVARIRADIADFDGDRRGHYAALEEAREDLVDLAVQQLPAIIARVKAAEEFTSLINALRADEGDAVMILCDNPDFNGLPNSAIECNGGWTDWRDRRFAGDTLIDCLRAAVSARAALEGQPK